MIKPVATYRVQLNRDFNFHTLKDSVPYLAKLGVSHIYASPIFQAKKGSTHGYDILNPNKINDELGGADAFKALIKEAADHGLGWIQDVVPNHLAYSTENPMITDLVEKGSNSSYHDFFDVDWNHPAYKLKHKILIPFLETSYKKALQQGQIKLVYKEKTGFVIKYKSLICPVKIEQLTDFLGSPAKATQIDKAKIKRVKEYYKTPTNLDALLAKQIYTLAYWKTALKQINYRRFFDILDLICLHTEEEHVFESIHQLIFKLSSQVKDIGLRIDHIDGLYNPEQYIEMLRRKAPEMFIVAEKILAGKEELPHTWQVQGTTGYDFLNYINGIFVDKEKEDQTDKGYKQFTGSNETFSELLYKCKKQVIQTSFMGDMDNLTRLTAGALRQRSYGKKLASAQVRKALIEVFAAFPVYRTYVNENNTSTQTQRYFRQALVQATQRNRELYLEIESLEKLLEECKDAQDALQVIMRIQQFTGVIMAKGFEDTALYRYNRLLSLNEVGGTPTKFGCTPEEFHAFNRMRQRKWPASLNATSTHDTKRGEDTRARLNVLSELPIEFRTHIETWTHLNDKLKRKVKSKVGPSRNEEFYIYQTLLGALPFNKEEIQTFVERLKLHTVKALRESKVNSNWINPQVQYEKAVTAFAVELLSQEKSREFLDDFLPFQRNIATYGVVNSLAQTLLKITSPGVPDFYQGTELWNLSMVDPDNRRPVDLKKLLPILEEITQMQPQELPELLNNPQDAKVKLYEIYKALQVRQKEKVLFAEGEYIPLKVKGIYKSHVIAFCRKKADTYAVTVVPRLLASLTKGQGLDRVEWEDTCICLPQNLSGSWQNIFTEKRTENTSSKDRLQVNELFSVFPVALLLSSE